MLPPDGWPSAHPEHAAERPRTGRTPERPTGTVTFLFTDIEGSTRRWDAQRALAASGWDEAVRVALHAGTANERDGTYPGPPLNHLLRLRGASDGRHVLLSNVTAALTLVQPQRSRLG